MSLSGFRLSNNNYNNNNNNNSTDRSTAVPQLHCLSHFSHHTRIYLSIIVELETSLNLTSEENSAFYLNISRFSSSSSDFYSKMTFSNLFKV